MIAFAWIEWNWGDAILDESWRDVLSLAAFAVTVIGFAVTIWQLVKTRSAARAAEDAANKVAAQSRFEYARLICSRAARLLQESKLHIGAEDWKKAEIRLGDLALK